MSALEMKALKQDSLQLLQAYQKDRTPALRNRVVELNWGLVRKEAHRWSGQCNESFDDLVQVGSIGLIRAIERFEPSRGNAFSSFAIPYIRGEIQHYLRDKSSTVRIPRRLSELRQRAKGVARNLRSELNRQPTGGEIAAAMGISDREWQEIELAARNQDPLSLDMPVGASHDEGNACLGELVPDAKYRSFQLAEEDRIRLQQSLVQIEDRTRSVLEFVFLHELTHKEVAETLDISVVTVSRHLKKGLACLKKVMASSEG
ncbi:MAG: RNA polymerase sigma factor SigF [Cyanobacteria bacterium J06641_5]